MNKKIIGATSLLAAGLVAGSFFSISGASAATHHAIKPAHVKAAAVTPSYPTTTTPATPTTPPTFKAHTPETVITGDLATELTNLALAANAGATVDRVENDTDGAVYEVHLTLANGSHVTVKFDANKTITGTETGPAFGPKDGKGGKHGFGDHDGDGPAGQFPPASSNPVTPLNG